MDQWGGGYQIYIYICTYGYMAAANNVHHGSHHLWTTPADLPAVS